MPTVVVAVDFASHATELCTRALPTLVALGARVVLLHQIAVQRAVPPTTVIHPVGTAAPTTVGAFLEADARDHLAPLAAIFEAAGLTVEQRLGQGPVVTGIVGLTEELGAALLVIGCDVRAGLGRVFLASFTDEILRASTCPVLVIRALGPADDPGPGAGRLQVLAETNG